MNIWKKITGIIGDSLGIGFSGPKLKKDTVLNDQLNIRNSADTADGKLKTGALKTSTMELSAVDGKKTTVSMADGASGDVVIVLPNNDGNTGDYVTTDGSGNWSYATGGSQNASRVYNYDLYHNSTSPIDLVNMSDNTWIDQIVIDVTEVFDGTGGRTVTVGLSEDTDKYVVVTDVDLTNVGTYIIDVAAFESTAAQTIATFTAATSGATAGTAMILCKTSVPA